MTAGAGEDLIGPALSFFFKLSEAWQLSDDEQLKIIGIEDQSTLESWRGGHCVDVDRATLERISALLGIFKAINTLLPRPQQADAWIRSPSSGPLFRGRSALHVMLGGSFDDLMIVRRYLDAQLI